MNMGDNSTAEMKSLVERLEHLEDEKARVSEDIRELGAEAKSNGFDLAAIKAIVKQRRMSDDQRAKRKALAETVDLYMSKLGMLADTPLGRAAMERDGVAAQ